MQPTLIQYIAQIRHEHTNYDKLSVFYHVQPWARRQLNQLITMLIQDRLDIPAWRQQVRQLEQTIDLTRRKPQRNYVRRESRRFRDTMDFTPDQAKKMAQSNLASVLKAQQTINAGIYDPHLFDDKFTIYRNRRG